MLEIRFELITKTASMFCSTRLSFSSGLYIMELSGFDPKITICKIAVLPIKL
jgi:hypothetical protein